MLSTRFTNLTTELASCLNLIRLWCWSRRLLEDWKSFSVSLFQRLQWRSRPDLWALRDVTVTSWILHCSLVGVIFYSIIWISWEFCLVSKNCNKADIQIAVRPVSNMTWAGWQNFKNQDLFLGGKSQKNGWNLKLKMRCCSIAVETLYGLSTGADEWRRHLPESVLTWRICLDPLVFRI